MKLEVLRFSSDSDSTLGVLFDTTCERKFLCFTLEDENLPTNRRCFSKRRSSYYNLQRLRIIIWIIANFFLYL